MDKAWLILIYFWVYIIKDFGSNWHLENCFILLKYDLLKSTVNTDTSTYNYNIYRQVSQIFMSAQ